MGETLPGPIRRALTTKASIGSKGLGASNEDLNELGSHRE